MLNNLFSGIFSSTVSSEISVPQFLLCIAVSLVIGAVLTLVYISKPNIQNRLQSLLQ